MIRRNWMPGWPGKFTVGKRPMGVHPLASIGGPPEHREWKVGNDLLKPDVHPTALIHAFCTVDAGMPGMRTTTVGAGAFLQARVHVGHNAIVGDDCEIGAGAVICGEVTIGKGAKIAGNSWVKPRVKIGDGAIIGGGSVVTKDVPAHEVWAGNPARYMKLAWTHPDYGLPATAITTPHPYTDPDQVWEQMARAVTEHENAGIDFFGP